MKNYKTLIYLATSAIVGYGVYHYFFSKKHFAKIIADSGNYKKGVSGLMNFDTPYLKAWSKAIKNFQTSFVLEGKTYNTIGGKIKSN
jgi:hypothetical protein